MSKDDIRWEQRFFNYKKALGKLDQAVQRIKKDFQLNPDGTIDEDEFLDDIVKEGVIQRFEYTHELAWIVMKDFLSEVNNARLYGSKDATEEAFAADLISDGEV